MRKNNLALLVVKVGSLETLMKRSPHRFLKAHEQLKIKLPKAKVMFELVTFLAFVF